jgi:Rha family phage regulatory protein
MNDLINIQNHDGQLTVSSREIADNFGKRHGDVIAKIEELIKTENSVMTMFLEGSYNAGTGKDYKEYYLTRDGFSLLVMGFTGSKAIAWKVRYIEAFNKMEESLKNPMYELIKNDPIMQLRYKQLEMEQRIQQTESRTDLIETRLNSIDGIDIQGDDQQKLNQMVRKYAFQQGLFYNKAWSEFKKAFNLAYRTNIELLIENYKKKHHIKNLTVPAYLKYADKLQDAVRVADKMLNR